MKTDTANSDQEGNEYDHTTVHVEFVAHIFDSVFE